MAVLTRKRTDEVALELLRRIENGIQLSFISDTLLNTLIQELEMEREYRLIQRATLVSRIMSRIKKPQTHSTTNVKEK